MQETIIKNLKEIGIKSICMDMYDIHTVQRTGIKMTFEEESFPGLIINIMKSAEHKMMTDVKGNNILWKIGNGYFKMVTPKAFSIFAKHLLGR